MKKTLALLLAALLCSAAHAVVAPAPNLHDPDATFEAYKATQQAGYAVVDAQYRDAIAAAPQDVELAIARCRFLENFTYAEDIDWSDTASQDLEACSADLAKRWPQAPAARVYALENAESEEATDLAESAWAAADKWPDALRARVAARLTGLYSDQEDDRAGEFAVIAARLGSAETVSEAISYLAGKGERKQAAQIAAHSQPATNGWMAGKRMETLREIGAEREAKRELERSLKAGLEIDAAEQVRTYVAANDLTSANRAAAKLGSDSDAAAARFELALANKDFGKARAMVAFGAGFETWVERYSKVVSKGPGSAFTLPLLPFTLTLLLIVFATALLPGVLLVPVHYRGLARRVRDRAPMPLFERVGLRHAWLAGAVVLIVPMLAVLAMRPDAFAAMFNGAEETASTQFSVVAMGSLLSLFVLLPWTRHLRIPPIPDRRALAWRTGLVVIGCWLVLGAVGWLSGVAHHVFVGGDSSTLQTRTVEALVRNSRSDYGLFATWLFIGVLTPILEEVTFRGLLLGGMSKHIGFAWANTWQALLFATIHGDPPRFFFYLCMGLFGGWLTRRYRSLLPAIALHALNNTIVIFLKG
jgi:membrane protease YdiL (CAAX protease family)